LLKGKIQADAIERVASALDQRAKEIIEQEVTSFRELAEFVHDVIVDFKRPTPDLVINIKTMANGKEKNFIPTLVNTYNAIARFLRIMKSFMIIVPGAATKEELENEDSTILAAVYSDNPGVCIVFTQDILAPFRSASLLKTRICCVEAHSSV
jgi:hypothetical protein